MGKVLLFSHSGFSDENANGITMKNLLSAWPPEEKAEFYCDVQPPDYGAAHHYFRITDMDAAKSFFRGKTARIFTCEQEESPRQGTAVPAPQPRRGKLSHLRKKYKYNFLLKWIREYLWIAGPWGKAAFREWVRKLDPEVLVYMVGESIFMDRLVMKVCRETGKPLVLYNGEGYRLIDPRERRGLERLYYRKTQAQYARLVSRAALAIYNSPMVREDYERRYPGSPRGILAYNTAQILEEPYVPATPARITYFGNLGVGRGESLVRAAEILERVDSTLTLDIYGKATAEQESLFRAQPNIRFHGFVDSRTLRQVIAGSDILLHVESFDETIARKLRYAFSTKIAQCLCSGRCFITFAPEAAASSRYLQTVEGVVCAWDGERLEKALRELVRDPLRRKELAEKTRETGLKNHQTDRLAQKIREEIEAIQIDALSGRTEGIV